MQSRVVTSNFKIVGIGNSYSAGEVRDFSTTLNFILKISLF